MTRLLPVRAITGHLVWSEDGSAWATYRVGALPYGWITDRDHIDIHARIRTVVSLLPADALLLGVCEPIDPAAVVGQLVDGVDLERHDAWREEALTTLDALTDAPLRWRRRFFLSVQLTSGGWRQTLTAARTAVDRVAGMFGMPSGLVSHTDVARATRQARQLHTRVARQVDLTPATPGDVRWLWARLVRRGVDEPFTDEITEPIVMTGRGVTVGALRPLLDGAVFHEGGCADDADRPAHRRYLRIDHNGGVGYHTAVVVADMPHEWVFPHGAGEWWPQLDRLPFPVDWVARVSPLGNAEARAATARQARNLAGQFDEHRDDTGVDTGPPPDLVDASGQISDEQAELAANRHEPELQTTMWFSLAAGSLEQLEWRAEALAGLFDAADYQLARPTGDQLTLAVAAMPGSPPPRLGDYTQHLLPRDFASGLPWAAGEVGDDTGMLLGTVAHEVDDGTDLADTIGPPVLWDPARGPQEGTGSVGVAGNLGSGKSYFLKRAALAVLARGGQVVILDRTSAGEYVAMTSAATCTHQVVSLRADAPVSLDPMRVFAPRERISLTVGFLTLLTRAAATDLEGVVLEEAVASADKRRDANLHTVLDELARRAEAGDDHAATVARKVASIARRDSAQLVFDADRPALRLDADLTVFHAAQMTLPSREELSNEHLSRQLMPEQILHQAVLYLVAGTMRATTFGMPDRFGVGLLDEAAALTLTPQGHQLVLDFIRDGRKHNAAVWLASQHADDFGDDALVHLLGSRFVFRQDRAAVPAAARLLGVDASTAVVDALVNAQTGTMLYRDALHAHLDTRPADTRHIAGTVVSLPVAIHSERTSEPRPVVESSSTAPAAVPTEPTDSTAATEASHPVTLSTATRSAWGLADAASSPAASSDPAHNDLDEQASSPLPPLDGRIEFAPPPKGVTPVQDRVTPAWTISQAAKACGISRHMMRRALDLGQLEGAWRDDDRHRTWHIPEQVLRDAGFDPSTNPIAGPSAA